MKVICYITAFILCTFTSNAWLICTNSKRLCPRPSIQATITAYTDSPGKFGAGKPSGTAIGTRVRPGIVAVSRDLLRSGWQFGKKVYIEDLGVFIIEDTMAPRFSKRIDVAVSDMHHARRIGKRTGKRVILLHQKKDAMTEQASALNKEKTNG